MSELDEILADGRAQANARMTETVIAELVHTESDTETGEPVRVVDAVLYGGVNGAPAQVKYPTLTVAEPVAGGAQNAVADIIVKIPAGSPRIPVGAEFRVISSTSDELLVGLILRVKGSPQSGQTTSHRYPVVEQQ